MVRRLVRIHMTKKDTSFSTLIYTFKIAFDPAGKKYESGLISKNLSCYILETDATGETVSAQWLIDAIGLPVCSDKVGEVLELTKPKDKQVKIQSVISRS